MRRFLLAFVGIGLGLLLYGAAVSEAQAVTLTATWTDTADNEDGFRVLQTVPAVSPQPVACAVAANVRTCAFSVPDTSRRCYVAVAFNTAGVSPNSNTVCTGAPVAPGTFAITTSTTTTTVVAPEGQPSVP